MSGQSQTSIQCGAEDDIQQGAAPPSRLPPLTPSISGQSQTSIQSEAEDKKFLHGVRVVGWTRYVTFVQGVLLQGRRKIIRHRPNLLGERAGNGSSRIGGGVSGRIGSTQETSQIHGVPAALEVNYFVQFCFVDAIQHHNISTLFESRGYLDATIVYYRRGMPLIRRHLALLTSHFVILEQSSSQLSAPVTVQKSALLPPTYCSINAAIR